jgi:serine/threonine-protein kinase
LANVLGADRFLNEIKVTAGLHHPHILALHDSGDADSFLYYVMPYVEGESLRDSLNRDGAMPVDEAMEILRELADALAYGHERGIVHRDIKPDNVLLSGRHALLADLGISKAVSDTTGTRQLTTVGVVLGTPAYMAPEQVTADPEIDHRADIYALGVVAYEMLTGHTPFSGRKAQEVLSAHLIESPTPIAERRVDLPDGLARLVMKCLEKMPEDRWQSAEAIVQELGLVARGESTSERGAAATVPSAGFRGRRFALAVSVVTLLAVGGVKLLTTFTANGDMVRSRIAVLPFENLGGADDDYFSEGITRDINTRIAKLGAFVVIAHGSARRAKAAGQSYLDTADQLGVQYVVDGSVSRAGGRVLISAALIDPQTNEQLWTNEYDRELSADHIFTIRGDVAQQVARALDVTLSPAQEADLSVQPTDNLEAYQEYLLGLFFWEKRTIEAFAVAIQHFEKAIALDPEYALAYAGLADVYLLRPWFSAEFTNREGLALADSMARRALVLDPTLAQPHATLGLVHEWRFEWEASEQEFVRSLELDPEYATARHWYGLLLARLGRHEEAQAQTRASLELDPLSPIISQDVGYVLRLGGEREESLRQTERTVELHPDFSTTILVLAFSYMEVGRFDDAGDALAQWAEVTGNDAVLVREIAEQAARYASAGASPVPTDLTLEAVFPPFAVPPFYVLLGQDERALDFLERGYEDGAFGVVSTMFGPPVDRLRSHPRFTALARKVGLPQGDRKPR